MPPSMVGPPTCKSCPPQHGHTPMATSHAPPQHRHTPMAPSPMGCTRPLALGAAICCTGHDLGHDLPQARFQREVAGGDAILQEAALALPALLSGPMPHAP